MTDATPPTDPYQATPQPLSPSDERLWATLIHVGGIFFGFIPALVGYLVLKDRGAFIRAHTQTALNFQLTMLLAIVVGVVLSWLGIGFLLIFAVYLLQVIFGIMAAVASNRGEFYTYPIAIRFVS